MDLNNTGLWVSVKTPHCASTTRVKYWDSSSEERNDAWLGEVAIAEKMRDIVGEVTKRVLER
jgi:hypothetical protein